MGKKRTVTSLPKGRKRELWHNFASNRIALAALIILLLMAAAAVAAGFVLDYDTDVIGQNVKERLLGPSAAHWFGTDNFGRDIFCRILWGARYSLSFGLAGTGISLFIGTLIGAVIAYYGGIADQLIMRFLDVFMCIPGMLIMLIMVVVIGPGMMGILVALIISGIPGYTRMVRSVVLSVREQDYIEAARASGSRDSKIILKHIIPNSLGPIIVNGMMSISGSILSAAGLSYLGMGVQAPRPEWGSLLSEAADVFRRYPHVMIFPGLALVTAALCFNLVGDGIADAVDPKRSR